LSRQRGAEFLITGAGLGRRAAAAGQSKHSQDTDLLVKRKGDGAADAHRLARLGHSLTVDADMAGVDQPLSQAAAFHDADAVEITVDAQVLTA
jgi:hypothetical protein